MLVYSARHEHLVIWHEKYDTKLVVHSQAIQILKRLNKPFGHALLPFDLPRARIVFFLIWHIWSLRISDLSSAVVLVFVHVGPNSLTKCPLGIRIDIHLHRSITDRFRDLGRIRSWSSMKDEVHRLTRKSILLSSWTRFRIPCNWYITS